MAGHQGQLPDGQGVPDLAPGAFLPGGAGHHFKRRGPAPCSAPRGKIPQLQPLVAPQVLHFMQVPLRTSV